MNCQICDKESTDWFLRNGDILRTDPKIITKGTHNGIAYTMELTPRNIFTENGTKRLLNVCTQCMVIFFRVSE